MRYKKTIYLIIGLVLSVLIVTVSMLVVQQRRNEKKIDDLTTKTFQKNGLTYDVLKPDPIMGASATLISKDHQAMLVDTQFSKSDAKKIVQLAEARQVKIRKIYISYSDPDYYFGTATILKSFPKAKVYATKATINRIKATNVAKLKVWQPTLKQDLPDKIIIPNEVAHSIQFAQEKFEIFGSDQQKQTLYVPKTKLALAGPLVATGSHLFMADTKTLASQQKWIDDLNELNHQPITTMIPSHFGKQEQFEKKDIIFTRDYIQRFMHVMQTSHESQEIIDRMHQAYPDLPDDNLEQSAKVVTGEENWD